ncbi:uncharacterized protein LOC124550823 [Schistocerca americana]|uniref:uncharacterized protein LOC124550823 n=1 Tax=Schistocerca americana TaxID=7009 RepID=UPI001F4F316A|nr:uncharacterized protein LOC124550823 [Schistocerca americana]
MKAHRDSQQRRRVSVVSYIHATSGRLRRPPRVERHAPARRCSPSSGRANQLLPAVLSQDDVEPEEGRAVSTSRSCSCSSISTYRMRVCDKTRVRHSVEAAASTNKRTRETQASNSIPSAVAQDLAACLPPGDQRPYDSSRYAPNEAGDDVLSYSVLPAEMLPFTAERHRAYDKYKYYDATPREVPVLRNQMALQLREELEQWRRSQASSVQSLEEQYPQWADWRADILPQTRKKRPLSAPEVRTMFREGSEEAEASDVKQKDELGTRHAAQEVVTSHSEPSTSQG